MTTRQPGNQASFFETHQEAITDLLDSFAIQTDGTPQDIVTKTQPWAQGDHALHNHEFCLNSRQTTAAYAIFEPLHMVGEVAPPTDTVDSVQILGGLEDSNDRRIRFAAQGLAMGAIRLAPGGTVAFWGGPRPTFESEKAGVEAMLQDVEFDASMPRTFSRFSAGESGLGPLDTDETVQGALVLQKYFGRLSLQQVDVREAYPPLADAPHPLVSGYTFRAEGFDHDIVLLHGRPVDRGALAGRPRHTTESCAQEWLEGRYSPLTSENDQHVLLVANNPYIGRTTLNVRQALDKHGAQSVRLSSCGPEGAWHITDRLRLGELARRLYAEHQLTLNP